MSTSNGNLPAELRDGSAPAKREQGRRWDVAGGVVTLEHVQLQRGWRHEVTVEHDAIDGPSWSMCECEAHGRASGPPPHVAEGCPSRIVDPGGPVRRRDTLWLPDHDQAQQLARAAVDALRHVAGDWPRDGLGQLARKLGITTAEHA